MVTCDRCGENMWDKEGNAGKLKLAWKKLSIKATLFTFFSGNCDGRHYFECEYNLCESCRQQLEKWMLGGKDSEKQVAKKCVIKGDYWTCPNCGIELSELDFDKNGMVIPHYRIRCKYCQDCGQRLVTEI